MLQKQYGREYTMDNVVISGTHTHSAPGGFMMSLLYDLTTFGFIGETYRALIDGIYKVCLNSLQRSNLSSMQRMCMFFALIFQMGHIRCIYFTFCHYNQK